MSDKERKDMPESVKGSNETFNKSIKTGDQPSKSKIKKWKYLFNNLYRSMDTLYFHIEEAGDEEQCSNALLYLAQSRNALMVLIERLQNLKQFEENPSSRGSVSWDVRKPSAQYPPYSFDPLPAPYNSSYTPTSGNFNPLFHPSDGDQHPAWLFPERPVPYKPDNLKVASGSSTAGGDLDATAAAFRPLDTPVAPPVAVVAPAIAAASPEKVALRVKEAKTTQQIQQLQKADASAPTDIDMDTVVKTSSDAAVNTDTVYVGEVHSSDAGSGSEKSAADAEKSTDILAGGKDAGYGSSISPATGSAGTGGALDTPATTWASRISVGGLHGLIPAPIQVPTQSGHSNTQALSGRARSRASSRSASMGTEKDTGFRDFPMSHSVSGSGLLSAGTGAGAGGATGLTLGELMGSTGGHVKNNSGSVLFQNELHTLDEERRMEYDKVFREAEDWIESRVVAEEQAWNDVIRNRIGNSPNKPGSPVSKPPGLNQDLAPSAKSIPRRTSAARGAPLPSSSFSVFGDSAIGSGSVGGFAEFSKTDIVSSSLVSLIGGSSSLLQPDRSSSKPHTASRTASIAVSDLAFALGSPPPVSTLKVDIDDSISQLSSQPTNLASVSRTRDSDLSPFGDFLSDTPLSTASHQQELTSALLKEYGSSPNSPSSPMFASHRRWATDGDSVPTSPSSTHSSLHDPFTPTSRSRGAITPTPSATSSTANSVGGASSTSSHYRSLHEKLSSPDRRKAALSPENARLKQEQRQLQAELNRERSVQEKKQRAMLSSSRAQMAEDRYKQQQFLANQTMEQKMQNAEQRRDEHIRSIKDKALNENAKVMEVAFINSMNEDQVQHVLSQKLLDAEKRINDVAERRAKHLEAIVGKNKLKHSKIKDQLKELKLKHEQDNLERWNTLQEKLRVVQERRADRLAEIQKRAEKVSTPATGPHVGISSPSHRCHSPAVSAPVLQLFSPDSGDNLCSLGNDGVPSKEQQDVEEFHAAVVNSKRKRKKGAAGKGDPHEALLPSSGSSDFVGRSNAPSAQEVFRQYLVRSFDTVCTHNTHTHDTNLTTLLAASVPEEPPTAAAAAATGKKANSVVLSAPRLAVLVSSVSMNINSLNHDQLQTFVVQCKTSSTRYTAASAHVNAAEKPSPSLAPSTWIGKATDVLKAIFKDKEAFVEARRVAAATVVDADPTFTVGAMKPNPNTETSSVVANHSFCVISHAPIQPKQVVKYSKRVAMISDVCTSYVEVVSGLNVKLSIIDCGAANADAQGAATALLEAKCALFTHMSVLLGLLLQHTLDSSFGIGQVDKAYILVDAMMGAMGNANVDLFRNLCRSYDLCVETSQHLMGSGSEEVVSSVRTLSPLFLHGPLAFNMCNLTQVLLDALSQWNTKFEAQQAQSNAAAHGNYHSTGGSHSGTPGHNSGYVSIYDVRGSSVSKQLRPSSLLFHTVGIAANSAPAPAPSVPTAYPPPSICSAVAAALKSTTGICKALTNNVKRNSTQADNCFALAECILSKIFMCHSIGVHWSPELQTPTPAFASTYVPTSPFNRNDGHSFTSSPVGGSPISRTSHSVKRKSLLLSTNSDILDHSNVPGALTVGNTSSGSDVGESLQFRGAQMVDDCAPPTCISAIVSKILLSFQTKVGAFSSDTASGGSSPATPVDVDMLLSLLSDLLKFTNACTDLVRSGCSLSPGEDAGTGADAAEFVHSIRTIRSGWNDTATDGGGDLHDVLAVDDDVLSTMSSLDPALGIDVDDIPETASSASARSLDEMTALYSALSTHVRQNLVAALGSRIEFIPNLCTLLSAIVFVQQGVSSSAVGGATNGAHNIAILSGESRIRHLETSTVLPTSSPLLHEYSSPGLATQHSPASSFMSPVKDASAIGTPAGTPLGQINSAVHTIPAILLRFVDEILIAVNHVPAVDLALIQGIPRDVQVGPFLPLYLHPNYI